MRIRDLCKEAFENAQKHGFTNQPIEKQMMNFHSEITEAWEELRNGHSVDEIYWSKDDQGKSKPEGVPIELADLVIRVFDTCGRYNINLEHAIVTKMNYNEDRTFRHGGKTA